MHLENQNLNVNFPFSTADDRLPPSLLLLPIRLKTGMLLLLPIRTTIRLRRLISGRLLRVTPQRHAIAARIRALDALIRRVALAQAHHGASAAALWLGVPQAVLAVGLVVRVAAAGAAADGEEPEERSDDGEGGGDPGDGEGAGAQVDFHVVGLEQGVEGAGEGGVEDCGGEGGEEGEEGGDLWGEEERLAFVLGRALLRKRRVWGRRLTIAMIHVHKLPHRLQMASRPTTIVMTVVQNATWYAMKFHLATFLYTDIAFEAESPSTLSSKSFALLFALLIALATALSASLVPVA